MAKRSKKRQAQFRGRMRREISKATRARVSARIKRLRKEGVPEKQAIAIAMRQEGVPKKRRNPKRAKKTKRLKPPKRARSCVAAKQPGGRGRKKAVRPSRRARSCVKQRTNPRWYDRLATSADARKYHDVAKVNRAYWNLSAGDRAAAVRKLERRGRRGRRAAIAIAKLEKRHAEGARPPRRNNPGMTDAEAHAEYVRTHWGEAGKGRVHVSKSANPAHGTATKLGTLVAVVYRTNKRGDGVSDYEHVFEGRKPTLAYNAGGLLVVGGDYTIEKGGIDG